MYRYVFFLIFLALNSCGLTETDNLAYEAEADCGFVQNSYGQRVAWSNKTLVLSVPQSWPKEYNNEVQSAAAKWNEAAGHEIVKIILSESASLAIDGINSLIWSEDWNDSQKKLQGLTQLRFNKNQITDADIKINAKHYTYYKETPSYHLQLHLESLLIHEIGHALGLKHIHTLPTVMESSLYPNTKRDTISSVDKASIECEYK